MTKIRKKEIVFDPEKRKNFLTGFRKRKNERRARAKEQLERCIKEERKRIRNDVKNSMASMKKTFQPLSLDPEVEDKFIEKEYEDEEVEINVIELATGNTKIQDDEDDESDIDTASKNAHDESYINTIPGMDFKSEASVKMKESKSNTKSNKPKDSQISEIAGKIANKKMLDKITKRKALKEFKKSKVFKQKERVEKKKQQRTTRRDKKFNKKGSNGLASGGKRGHGHGSKRGRRK